MLTDGFISTAFAILKFHTHDPHVTFTYWYFPTVLNIVVCGNKSTIIALIFAPKSSTSYSTASSVIQKLCRGVGEVELGMAVHKF